MMKSLITTSNFPERDEHDSRTCYPQPHPLHRCHNGRVNMEPMATSLTNQPRREMYFQQLTVKAITLDVA